jgi:hypothetical protein
VPPPTWLAAQVLPSPEWLVSRRDVSFGLRWQLTPLLFSFGLPSSTRRWRMLIVEPLVRHAGSTELFVSPEYLRAPPAEPGDSRWGARVGLRTYLPLITSGEALSMSLGTSYLRLGGQGYAAYELGAYTLFGVFGIQASYAPRLLGGSALFTLSVRYF